MPRRPFWVGSGKRDPGLDFLRALAILLVMVRHFLDRNPAYDPKIPKFLSEIGLWGWSGVDLFFVLSGFLIFRIIFDQEVRGTFNWAVFYSKRIYRIWPAYFTSLIVAALIGQFAIAPQDLIYFVLFIQNYVGPLADINGGVYWSIAVEEHFYIITPLLLIGSEKLRKYRLYMIIFVLFLSPILRFFIYEIVVNDHMRYFYSEIYFPTHSRFDSLLFGVLCAHLVTFNRDFLKSPVIGKLLPISAVVLFVAAFVTSEALNQYGQQPSLIAGVLGFSLTAMFWAAVLLTNETYRLFDKFGRGAMKWIAYISYSMYLYHIMALNFWGEIFSQFPDDVPFIFAHAVLFVVTTIIISAMSYYFIERYFLLKKQKLKGAHLFKEGSIA